MMGGAELNEFLREIFSRPTRHVAEKFLGCSKGVQKFQSEGLENGKKKLSLLKLTPSPDDYGGALIRPMVLSVIRGHPITLYNTHVMDLKL